LVLFEPSPEAAIVIRAECCGSYRTKVRFASPASVTHDAEVAGHSTSADLLSKTRGREIGCRMAREGKWKSRLKQILERCR
jgi:hypothetical protein